MNRATKLVIDILALRHNVKRVRQFAPVSKVLAMLKANAYGHDICIVGKEIEDLVDAIGVALLQEAISLRSVGVLKPIVLMSGVSFIDELILAAKYNISLIVHDFRQIELLEKYSGGHIFNVWLKIDTGMHRLGFDPLDLQAAWKSLFTCDSVRKPVGLMTHVSEIEIPDSVYIYDQFKLFSELTADFVTHKSIAKSGLILTDPRMHLDWIRPGIILYGASPWPDIDASEYNLLPVMSFYSCLMVVRKIAKNESVGYGRKWIAKKETLIGVVAVGYGDGYPQNAQNGTPVLVNDRLCHLVGRVSMDMLTVDLSGYPDAKIGDRVTLWGKGLPIEIVAKSSGSSSYELFTRITKRVNVTHIFPGSGVVNEE